MSNYPNAGDGLRKIYVALIGMMVCILFNIVPVIGFLGSIGTLIFQVVYLVGCYQAGKDIPGCMTAFILEIMAIVIAVITSVKDVGGVLGLLFGIADIFLPIIIMALICFSVAGVMRKIGAEDAAKQGVRAWWIYLASSVLSAVLGFVFLLTAFSGNGFGGLIVYTVLLFAITLVGYIFLLKFLKNSGEHLGSY